MGVGPLVFTDRAQARTGLLDTVRAVAVGGAGGVLLREKDLPRRARAELAVAILDVIGASPPLLVASDVALAAEVGAVGVHLSARDPWPEQVGVTGSLVVGRSCHSEAELHDAAAAGADYVTLSPVYASPSKPGYGPALGVAELARLCQTVPGLPVVALGGVAPGRVAACLAAGAAGVATMGEAMRAADPADLVASLVAEARTGRREAGPLPPLPW